jgi:hypothetical protein
MKVIDPITLKRQSPAFTRASIASYRNQVGQFKVVDANILRSSYRLKSVSTLDNVFTGFLIEPSRTNYLTGTASSLTTSASPLNIITQSVSVPFTTSNYYLTFSFFGNGIVTLTSGVTLNITLNGNSNSSSDLPTYVTFPHPGGTILVTVSGSVYAANLEALDVSNFNAVTDIEYLTTNTRPTSWIPTTTTAQTRAADVLSQEGIFFNSFGEPAVAWEDTPVSYSIGDRVLYNDFIYFSKTNDNIGNIPSTSTLNWTKVQTSNQYALMDLTENSTSSGPNADDGVFFGYVFKSFNELPESLAAIEVNAKNLDLTLSYVTSSGVFTKTTNNVSTSILTTIDGLIKPVGNIAGVVDSLIDTYNKDSDLIAITLSLRIHNGINTSTGLMLYPDSTVSIGEVVIGPTTELGDTQYGAEVRVIDYSKKSTNEFGVTSWIKRGFSKKLSCKLTIDNNNYNLVLNKLSSLLSVPTVWIMTSDDRFSSGSVIFGAAADFSLAIQYPTMSLCSLEIEGLVI